ncbi:electron transfer flavoprotein subunit alpha/FixB family protein [Anaerovorax odorimutans]|uniref:Electron transfer flavoprotein subunit alpha/FixB family protein n=1 Tax=Anaerovorax odorimutans TaxID=109327 RepID=A0ABT1RMN9_9FIRM|nr:electron transfer flavoprotein subunit alpha/FixB family protein [Anaerovorax odorimutans]MCQ4636451.1 electron transfer flavoprotein subunit alpha/FixB family protein [Anaerovorax odorimutans]
MKKSEIKKVMVYDQGLAGQPHPSFWQNMAKLQRLLQGEQVEFVRLCCHCENPQQAVLSIEQVIKAESPDLLVIAATPLGEEVAPALGVRLKTGVAAHCADIVINGEDRIAYMVPAFGGKVIGEIFIPGSRPAIATVKPGVFSYDKKDAADYREILCDCISEDSCGLRIVETEEIAQQQSAIEKAELIFCGGFGIGSKESWQKLEALAKKTGGGAGCTRPVVDMDWGPDEYYMIGTSGKTVRPKVYIGFGISGAAHHLCGIKDADIIISINNDKNAEVFAASDYKAVLDANQVIDRLAEKL